MRTGYEVQDDLTDSVGLLISILVRYPEVSVINYDPSKQIFKFNFICSRVINESEFNDFKKYFLECMQSFNYLEKKNANLIEISHQVYDDLTLLEIKRDVASLAQEEISLAVQIVCQYWRGNLVSDFDDHATCVEEDLIIQDEIIEHMLESIKGSVQDKYLYAFREEGRVIVFNK